MNLERLEGGLRQLLAPDVADGVGCPAADLYRFASGQSSSDEARAFEAHLATCADCRADLEVFRTAIAEEAGAARAHRARPPSLVEHLHRWISAWTLVPAAVVATVLVAFGLWRGQVQQTPAPDSFQVKSGYKLHVAVQRGKDRFMGDSGSVLQPGDILGFFYTAPADAYLAVLVGDETGAISQAYPQGVAQKLPKGAEQRLPSGAVVEEGPPCEWIVAFFSAQPLAYDVLRGELARAVAGRGPQCSLPAFSTAAATDVFVLRRAAP